MAVDKAVDSSVLNAKLRSVADAIRAKGGTSEQLDFLTGEFEAAIEAFPEQYVLEAIKSATPSLSAQQIRPSSGKDALLGVNIDAITSTLLRNLDSDFTAANIKKDVNMFGLVGTYAGGSPTTVIGYLDRRNKTTSISITGLPFTPNEFYIVASLPLTTGQSTIFDMNAFIEDGETWINCLVTSDNRSFTLKSDTSGQSGMPTLTFGNGSVTVNGTAAGLYFSEYVLWVASVSEE